MSESVSNLGSYSLYPMLLFFIFFGIMVSTDQEKQLQRCIYDDRKEYCRVTKE